MAAGDVVERVEGRPEGRGGVAEAGVEEGPQGLEGRVQAFGVAQAVGKKAGRGVPHGGLEGVEGEARGAAVGGLRVGPGAAAGGAGGFEVGQGVAAAGGVGQGDLAQQPGGLGEQPVEGADALFEVAVVGLGVEVAPEGFAQAGGEGVAVGQPGEAAAAAEGLGEPAGDAEVFGVVGQQGLAAPDDAGPVGLLELGDPLALGQAGVVGAAGLLDRVEGCREAQVAAAGGVGEG